MRAIILAAGRGSRLQQTADRQLPKCLLRSAAGACSSGICGCSRPPAWRRSCSRSASGTSSSRRSSTRLAGSRDRDRAESAFRARQRADRAYRRRAADARRRRAADGCRRALSRAHHGRAGSRARARSTAVDRSGFRSGRRAGEAVRARRRAGRAAQASSQPGLQYDTIGESVGFFRFDERASRRLAAIVADYVASGRARPAARGGGARPAAGAQPVVRGLPM